MELNFLYNDGTHFKKLRFVVTELDYTIPYSQINVNRSGEAQIGWLPIVGGGWKTTVPRYFGSINQKAYYNRIPAELRSKIQHWDGENVYELNKTSSFLGTAVTQGQVTNYTGVDLYAQDDDGVMKKVCKFGWAYTEVDNPNPGQTGKIPRIWYSGLQTFKLPDDVGEHQGGTLSFGSYNPNGAYSEVDKPKISLWTIKVQDDITGSPTYGQEFPVLVEAFYHPTGYSTQGAIFIDVRALTGTEDVSPTPEGSDPKKNSTPSGWGGNRNTASSNDVITSAPYAIARTVNFGGDEGHGIYLYKIDAANLAVVAQSLWASSLLDKFRDVIYSPASGILGCHILPYQIDSDEMTHTVKLCGTEAKFSNMTTDVEPTQVPGLNPVYTYAYASWAVAAQNHHSEVFYVEPFFNSFLDFEPYTKIQLRLPFIGTVPIPTSAVMGGYIMVNYILDNRNGNCVAQVYAISMRNHQTDDANGGILIGQWSGNCALSMALTGNSMGSQEVVGAIKGFASNAVGTIIQDNSSNQTSPVGGLVSAGVNAGLDILTARHEPRLFGTLNSSAGPLTDLTCRLIVTRPVDVTPGSYKVIDGVRVFSADGLLEQKGLAAYSGGTVGQYSGITQGYVLGNIDGATEGEIKEIRRLFAEGVNIRG